MTIAKPKVFWPLRITASSNDRLSFRELGDVVDRDAQITPGTYLSMDLLLAAVKTAMDAVSALSDPWTITLNDDTGLITFTAAGGTSFTLRFATSSFQMNTELGFFNSNVASTGLTLTSTFQHQNGWYPNVAVKTDSKDMYEQPNSIVTVSIGGNVKSITETELITREVAFHFLDAAHTRIDAEGSSTDLYKAMERWWRTGRGRFRYWADGTAESTYGDYFLALEVVEEGFKPDRMFIGKELYRVGPWKMRKYI